MMRKSSGSAGEAVRNVPIQLPQLYPWQQEVWAALHDPVIRFVVCSTGQQIGKALALDTPIPTHGGWKTMGEIEVGDVLFDECGQPCIVTLATEVMEGRHCYEVEFSDGTTVVADADHLWQTHTRAYRKALSRTPRPRSAPTVVTTEQIKNSLRVDSIQVANHAVPLPAPVEYPEQNLPIPPYLLGAWLGDGTSTGASIASNDPEIPEAFAAEGYPIHKLPRPFTWSISDGTRSRSETTGAYQSKPESFKLQLKTLGLLGNKHIPEPYLVSSVPQRLALLQGLMDTDGSITERGAAEFISINENLAQGVRQLVASLGMQATIHTKRMRLYGLDVGMCYRVNFSPIQPVFRLTRKAVRVKSAHRRADPYYRYIVEVRETESVPVRCIQVNSPSHLYLASESYIPTHNTSLGVLWGIEGGLLGESAWWVAPDYTLTEAGYDILNEVISHPPFPDLVKEEKKRMRFNFTNGGKQGWLQIRSADDPNKLRSRTLHRVIFDEAALASPDAWHGNLSERLTIHRGKALIIFNPHGKNWAWELWRRGDPENPHRDPEWRSFQFSQYANPNIAPEDIEKKRQTMTRAKFQSEVMGDFVDSGGQVFVNVRDQAAIGFLNGIVTPDPSHRYVAGLDISGGRHDWHVLMIEDATLRAQVGMIRFSTAELQVMTRTFLDAQEHWNLELIDGDETTIGIFPMREFQNAGLRIRPLNLNMVSKRALIEDYAAEIELRKLRLLNDPTVIYEHESYQAEEMASGYVRYNAPREGTDDTVIAGALAHRAATLQDARPPISFLRGRHNLWNSASAPRQYPGWERRQTPDTRSVGDRRVHRKRESWS